MKGYIIYHGETGYIRRIMAIPKALDAQASANVTTGFKYVWYSGDDFIASESKIDITDNDLPVVAKTTQSITATPSSIDADGSTASLLTGIAKDSKALLVLESGSTSIANIYDSTMKFCTDIVGTHDITFKHPAWLDTTVTITATAP